MKIQAAAIHLALLTLLLGGCATADKDMKNTVALEDREYVTGSNLPVKRRAPATDEERAAAQAAAREMGSRQISSGVINMGAIGHP
jgi:hypothetical protein